MMADGMPHAGCCCNSAILFIRAYVEKAYGLEISELAEIKILAADLWYQVGHLTDFLFNHDVYDKHDTIF